MRSLPREEIVDSFIRNAGKVATPPGSAMALAPEYSTFIGQILIILSCHWSVLTCFWRHSSRCLSRGRICSTSYRAASSRGNSLLSDSVICLLSRPLSPNGLMLFIKPSTLANRVRNDITEWTNWLTTYKSGNFVSFSNYCNSLNY